MCYVKTAGSNRTYLRNRQLLQVDTAWQVTEEECYEVTCLQLPPELASCIKSSEQPWQLAPLNYKRTEKPKRKTVLFSTKEDEYYFYEY